jgi:hypothetical protein
MEQMGIVHRLKTVFLRQVRERAHPQPTPSEDLRDVLKEGGAVGPGTGYAARRRYERFAVTDRDLRVKAALTEVIQLSNVSVGGACIITTRVLQPGDNVLLKIPSEKVEKPLKCTIIWEAVSDRPLQRNGEDIPAYKAGLKFSDLLPGTIVRLKDYMRSAGIPEEGNRDEGHAPSPLRFSIFPNERARMSCSATFPVRKISLGGMLVEAASELEIGVSYPAALYLPGNERPVRFNGRIASQIPLAGCFGVGIEFCDMSGDDRKRLSEFLDTLAVSR